MSSDWLRWLDVGADGQLPRHDHAARRAPLQAGLGELVAGPHTAALLVSAPGNIRWACGFTGSNGALLLTPDDAVLVTDARYEGRAATECPDLAVHLGRPVLDSALELAAELGVDRVAFEGDHVTHSQGVALQATAGDLDLADVVSVHGRVERERTTKDDAELARLARACAVTEAVLDDVLGVGAAGTTATGTNVPGAASALVGRTEREVARAVEDGFRGHGADVGFATIVASGPNGAVPHHAPTDRRIAEGDLVTIDAGARVDGYHADTTRTVAAGTLPDDRGLGEVHALVASAQDLGVAAAIVGARGRDVDAAARDHLTAAGYGDRFVHGCGHGVGLDIHEAPAVSATSSASLHERTVLTVEPGVYLPGRGGVRIEDTVVVTTDGPVRLTTSPHDLLVV